MSSFHDLSSYAKLGSTSLADPLSLELVNIRRSSDNGNSHDIVSTASLLPDELDQLPRANIEAERAPSKRLPGRLFSTIKAWWLEVVAILVSIASLTSIAGILLVYQDQPLSSWPYHYQPNSVVSQLTTVARSAMMLAVASCISQSFWLHIEQRPRKILAMQTFDRASRGPAGAALLLASTTRSSLIAIIGSLITIATLFMESSTQQLLRYPFRTDTGVRNGTFPVTQNYVPTFYTKAYGWNGQLDGSIQAAIIDSVFGSPYADAFSYPTNSCSWDSIAATLGVCSSCTDVTNTTKRHCASLDTELMCNYTTPEAFQLNATMVSDAEAGSSPMIRTVALDGQGIVSFASLIQGESGNIEHPQSITECQISYCAKVYRNASVVSGKFAAEVQSHRLTNRGAGDEIYRPGQDFPATLNSTFSVEHDPTFSLTRFLVSVLNTGNLDTCSGGCVDTPGNALSFGVAMLNQPSIPHVAKNLANSLTNVIRNSSTMNATQVIGKSYQQVQFIGVRWEWIIFPASLILLSLVILVITMSQSHNSVSMTWRSSPLAMLFHPLQGWSEDEMCLDSAPELEKLSKKMHGQLRSNQDGALRIVKS